MANVHDFLRDHGYSCCFEGKDFVVGEMKQKNLTAAIQCSRRVIAVLSRQGPKTKTVLQSVLFFESTCKG